MLAQIDNLRHLAKMNKYLNEWSNKTKLQFLKIEGMEERQSSN